VAKYVEIGRPRGRAGAEREADGGRPKLVLRADGLRRCDAKMRVASRRFAQVTTGLPIGSLGGDPVATPSYGLSGSIYTQDVNKAFAAMREFETGIFYVNSSTIGAEVHLPFGGIKDTGNGHREAGIAGLDVFTEWKSIYVDFSGKLQKAQIDTH
jgi:aldehyde dehydrogenase (NAD+)